MSNKKCENWYLKDDSVTLGLYCNNHVMGIFESNISSRKAVNSLLTKIQSQQLEIVTLEEKVDQLENDIIEMQDMHECQETEND